MKYRASTIVPLAIFLLLASGCSSINGSLRKVVSSIKIVDDSGAKPVPETPKEYSDAVRLLEEQQFERAAVALDSFLKKEPTTPWTQAAIFNLGRAYEGLEQWSEAAEKYRAVIGGTTGRAPKLRAYALYRLSFCYEALSLDSEAVATLKDALSQAQYLEREIGEAELPARLAAAYARVGNHGQADIYYERAETGIANLKRDPEKRKIPKWLPRTLYYMGSMSLRHVSWDDFEVNLRPLKRSQVYLLQAAELGEGVWSKRAAADLNSVYRDLWTVIEKAPMPSASDPLLGRRRQQERQWDLAALVQEHLAALRAFRLPSDSEGQMNEQVKAIFALADELELKIARLYLERPAGEGLTPESLARQRSVRGRVVSPDSTLEKLFTEGAALPPKAAAKASDKSPDKLPDKPGEMVSAPPDIPEQPPITLPATHIPDHSAEDPNL